MKPLSDSFAGFWVLGVMLVASAVALALLALLQDTAALG